MICSVAQWTLDVHDVQLVAGFWARALGYRIHTQDDGNVKLWPPADATGPTISVWLQPTAAPKRDKNRLHPDLVADVDVELAADRLVGLGATRVDVGQTGDEPFIVLADPEGNEFCLLESRPAPPP
jgi:Glyoxalase-like domain